MFLILRIKFFRQQIKQTMIAICIFSLFFQTIFCEAACDGEVTSCGDCTSSSETFMQCNWCSSNGHCNGKLDVFSECSNGGQWVDACADDSCSASDKKSIEVSQSSQCASTSTQCAATSCFVFLAKITRSSASCVQFYQTDCKTFVSFFSFDVIYLLSSFYLLGMS